ncbi:helix-turn-helix transcriptional regulator [Rhizobium sp. LjRoot30]|uniref:helix-turn-helix domain-containing protein n=1 Tax=Rhizobium sp. LjRoot30 TaxID=3342320 RepID=UPI003ECEC5CE
MVEAGQVRAARALLNWKQIELAEKAGVSVETVKRMEARATVSGNIRHIQAVVSALEAAGCTFLPDDGNGPGVRAKVPAVDE